jgi:hypothetical protein
MANGNLIKLAEMISSLQPEEQGFVAGDQPEFNPSDFFGEHSEFLGETLKGRATGMSDVLKQLLTTGKKDIARGATRTREQLRELGASSGFRGTGANIQTDLFAEEAGQISKLETGIGQASEASNERALQQLLGLTSFQGGQQLGTARLGESARQFGITTAEQARQFEKMFGLKERELAIAEEQASGDFFGDLLKETAGFFTGGLSDIGFEALEGLLKK